MRLVIVALVLISSAISSNGQVEVLFYDSESKTLNKLDACVFRILPEFLNVIVS
jgi:hypothetical protein